MVKGAVVKFAVPVVFEDVFQAKLVPESEDAVRTGFRGIEIVLGMFEGSELFDRKVFREAFDRETGKIVGHLMCSWSVDRIPFNSFCFIADCSFSVDW